MSYGGAPLVTAPKIVSVTFPGDTLATSIDTFGSSLTASAYWSTVSAGYCSTATSCIGAGTGSSVALTAAPGASYTDSSDPNAPAADKTLQTYLKTLFTGATLPAPTADTIYVFYFPSTTTITYGGGTSCTEFGGYHNQMTVGTQQVIYGIVPECTPFMPPDTPTEQVTFAGSHEVMESATDGIQTYDAQGDPVTSGFTLDFNSQATVDSSTPWLDIYGFEVADLCVDQLDLGQDETTENGFTVQRIGSIANAAAGKDPCVPVPAGEVYYNAFPTVSVVVLDVGKSTTIEVDALATGAMGAWTVTAIDGTDPTGDPNAPA